MSMTGPMTGKDSLTMNKFAPPNVFVTPAVASATQQAARVKAGAALAAALCGLGLLWVVGFSEIEVLHNIAHDTRHSNLFPCH